MTKWLFFFVKIKTKLLYIRLQMEDLLEDTGWLQSDEENNGEK